MKINSHQHFRAINRTDSMGMGAPRAAIKRDFLPAEQAAFRGGNAQRIHKL